MLKKDRRQAENAREIRKTFVQDSTFVFTQFVIDDGRLPQNSIESFHDI